MGHQRYEFACTGEASPFHEEDRFSPQNEADYERLERIAAAGFTEMVANGWGAVGEFHYVHHRADGESYPDHDMELALASTWRDFEDACLNQVAHRVKPDAVVTGNVKDFALSDFPVFDCDGLFEWIRKKDGISYCEIAFGEA